MNTLTEQTVRELEEQLRLAMLESNVAVLDTLIHNDLLFVGPRRSTQNSKTLKIIALAPNE